MKLISITKIGDDWGGDNLLFQIHLQKSDKKYIKAFEGLGYKATEILYDINRNYETDFQWNHEVSYDNMDYNGHFLETVYIDVDNLTHKMENNKVIITDDFIIDLIMGDCGELVEKILMKYQEELWLKIDYENDIYEQFLDSECVSYSELCDLEDLANQKITIQDFADKQGYEWEVGNMQNEERIKEIRKIIKNFADQDQYSANNEYVKALYRELRDLEGKPQIEEEDYEPVFIGGSDVPIGGYYE